MPLQSLDTIVLLEILVFDRFKTVLAFLESERTFSEVVLQIIQPERLWFAIIFAPVETIISVSRSFTTDGVSHRIFVSENLLTL